MLDGHGDDLHLQKGDIQYNFSSNVYHQGTSPLLKEHLQGTCQSIGNYPSPTAHELNILAAKKHDLAVEQLLFTNGATEAFYLIAQHYKDKNATIVSPTFSEYEDACRIHELTCEWITRDEIETYSFPAGVAFICNPNNPDGRVSAVSLLETIIQRFPETHFVIDEAYLEFSLVAETAIELISQFQNLTIVKSLTKTFAIPGLRLGYLISSEPFIQKLLTLKMPWTVNSLAISAGHYIFEHYENLTFDVKELIAATQSFQREVDRLMGFSVLPSATTYFLVHIENGTAQALKEYLTHQHGILVRDATNFTKLEGEYIRISLQSIEAQKALIEALKIWN